MRSSSAWTVDDRAFSGRRPSSKRAAAGRPPQRPRIRSHCRHRNSDHTRTETRVQQPKRGRCHCFPPTLPGAATTKPLTLRKRRAEDDRPPRDYSGRARPVLRRQSRRIAGEAASGQRLRIAPGAEPIDDKSTARNHRPLRLIQMPPLQIQRGDYACLAESLGLMRRRRV